MASADEYLYKVQVDNLKLTDVTRHETYDVKNRCGKGVRTAISKTTVRSSSFRAIAKKKLTKGKVNQLPTSRLQGFEFCRLLSISPRFTGRGSRRRSIRVEKSLKPATPAERCGLRARRGIGTSPTAGAPGDLGDLSSRTVTRCVIGASGAANESMTPAAFSAISAVRRQH